MNRVVTLKRIERRLRLYLGKGPALKVLVRLRRLLDRHGLGNLTVNFDGLTLTGALIDRTLLAGLAEHRFEPYTLELWQSLVRPGMKVLDVGAHIGAFASYAGRIVGEEGHVWAIEANPATALLLKRNLRRNVGDRATVVVAAASDRSGSARLRVPEGDRAQSSLIESPRSGIEASYEVSTVRLDDVVDSVDVVKIDVEGNEMAVLAGMEHLLPAVEALVIESNARALEAAGSSREALHGFLLDAGFEIHVIDDRGHRLRPSTEPIPERCCNVLARRGPRQSDASCLST